MILHHNSVRPVLSWRSAQIHSTGLVFSNLARATSTGLVFSNLARATIKTPLVKKATEKYRIKSISLEKYQDRVSGLRYAPNRVPNAVC